ncbi:MAG: hypothetical protein AAF218_03710 [Pseudomonadota bacterium]
MIDTGLIVIAIFVLLIGLVIWSWRSKNERTGISDHTRTQPGRRLEGADHTHGGAPD